MAVGIGLSLLAAGIPSLLYALAFAWADRHEREPLWLMIVVFFWGALPAVILSLIGGGLAEALFPLEKGTFLAAAYGGSFVAPVVEETAKGAILFGIYRFMHHEFDGLLDGLTYGALVGFGFGMTEDFFYYVQAFSDDGLAGLTLTAILRGVVFKLNHSVFTACTGVGLGLAVHCLRPGRRRLYMATGLLSAMILHGLHNLGATAATHTRGASMFMSLALAAAGILMILAAYQLAWRQEREWIWRELHEDVGVLLSPEEHVSLSRGWRRPHPSVHGSRRDHGLRLRTLVKLALAKHRRRRRGASVVADAQLARLRGEIGALLHRSPLG